MQGISCVTAIYYWIQRVMGMRFNRNSFRSIHGRGFLRIFMNKTTVIILILFILTLIVPMEAVESSSYQQGIGAFGEGDYHQAVDHLQAALEEEEKGHYLYYLLGLSHFRLNQEVEARENLLQSKELNPDHYHSYTNLARVELALGNYDQALKIVDEALNLQEGYDAYHLQGRAYLNLEQLEEAYDSFSRALELEAENVYILNGLALTCIHLGRFEEARELLLRAADGEPELAYVYNNLGIASENLGLIEEARQAYQRALEIDPHHSQAAGNLERLE